MVSVLKFRWQHSIVLPNLQMKRISHVPSQRNKKTPLECGFHIAHRSAFLFPLIYLLVPNPNFSIPAVHVYIHILL